MSQYESWEDSRKNMGLMPARQLEKSLRWDGVTDSYSGLGYEVITAHLAAQSDHRISKSP